MYNIGDRVVYGTHGVCHVVNVEQRTVDRKIITYLVLEPFGQPGSKYLVPTHNAAAMSKLSPILSREALKALLSGACFTHSAWIREENARKQRYRELISSGDRTALLQMVAALYRHREEQEAAGRKVHLCDDNFLRDAEKLLCGEIALVLELEYEEARSYLRKALTPQ